MLDIKAISLWLLNIIKIHNTLVAGHQGHSTLVAGHQGHNYIIALWLLSIIKCHSTLAAGHQCHSTLVAGHQGHSTLVAEHQGHNYMIALWLLNIIKCHGTLAAGHQCKSYIFFILGIHLLSNLSSVLVMMFNAREHFNNQAANCVCQNRCLIKVGRQQHSNENK